MSISNVLPITSSLRLRRDEPKGWGRTSGPSVIRRLSSLFQAHDSPPLSWMADEDILPVRELFDSSHPLNYDAVDLPDDVVIMELFTTASERSTPSIHILNFKDVTSAIEEKDDSSAQALLHATCALGFLISHSSQRCRSASENAWRHFTAARRRFDISHCDGVMSLQTLLCLTMFSLNTCQLWRAHTYSSIALSWVLQLGLHDERQSGSHLKTASHEIHLYICSVLGFPPAAELPMWAEVPGIHDSRLGHRDAADYRYKILTATSHGLITVFAESDNGNVDLGRLSSIEGSLQELVERAFASIVHSSKLQSAMRAKAELELTAYGCQLKLYIPFLHHLVTMANGTSTSRTRSQRVLACIKAASKTITLCDSLMRQDLLEPSSWFQTYTLFLAVLTLLFLIAAHKGTTQPSKAWTKGEQGIRILAAMRCASRDNAAAKSLDVIRALVERLSHTVQFDVDEIERMTPSICGSQRTGGGAPVQDKRPTIAAIINQDDERPFVNNSRQNALHAQTSTADGMLARANEFVLFAAGDEFQFGNI